MLIRSWSSRLPDSVWEFYAGGQRSCDWGKEIFASFFPVAVLWALSIWSLWFNLQCLTPSVICSDILYVKSDTIFMEDMRESFKCWKDFVSLEIHSFAACSWQQFKRRLSLIFIIFMRYADVLGLFWRTALVVLVNAMGGCWTQNPLLLEKRINCSRRAIKERPWTSNFAPQELEILRDADLSRWPRKRIQSKTPSVREFENEHQGE